MNRLLLAALVGIFAVGLLIGAVVGAAASDSSDPDATAADCDRAVEVVDAANDRIAEVNASGAAPSVEFFAALLSEQLAIVHVMDAEPTCFTLAERAGAAGLAGGLQALAAGFGSAAASATVPVPAPDEGEPTGSTAPDESTGSIEPEE